MLWKIPQNCSWGGDSQRSRKISKHWISEGGRAYATKMRRCGAKIGADYFMRASPVMRETRPHLHVALKNEMIVFSVITPLHDARHARPSICNEAAGSLSKLSTLFALNQCQCLPIKNSDDRKEAAAFVRWFEKVHPQIIESNLVPMTGCPVCILYASAVVGADEEIISRSTDLSFLV